MSEKLLEVKNLEVIYKTDLETIQAVNNISFTLDKGETIGIVGETGAGKTTTALTILRLLPSNIGKVLHGSIEFCGEDLLKIPEYDMRSIRGKHISMIFQDPMTALNPLETVGDQIAEALFLHSDFLNMQMNRKNKKSPFKKWHKGGKKSEEIEKRVDECLLWLEYPPAERLSILTSSPVG